MASLSEYVRKWWLPVAAYLLASSPPAVVLLLQSKVTPYITAQSPELLLNVGVLLLWLVLVLSAFAVLQKPWLRWDEPTGTWVGVTSDRRYCAKCRAVKIVTPLKNEVTGWRCMHCERFFHDPARAHVESPRKKGPQRDRI